MGIIALFLWIRLRTLNVETMYEQVTNMAKQDLQDWLNKDGQKVLIQIGALIGAGARQGAGFGIPKGKGGIEGIVGQLLAGFVQNKLGQVSGSSNQPQSVNQAWEQ